VLRATVRNVLAGGVVQGASTITQQVARNMFLSSERRLARKIKEAILAYRIEKHFTKQDILGLYLNHIYLGQGAYGVQAAALTYFGRPVDQLNLLESAFAGLPKAPSATRRPSTRSGRSKGRLRVDACRDRAITASSEGGAG
jgi:penicillin-binding protein 1A